jgi:hypothetical protein
MKLAAYILAADPTWLEISLTSYYSFVDEIVVSCDEHLRGWAGLPVPIEKCLEKVHALDVYCKCRSFIGDFFNPYRLPIENDTFQRQSCLDVLSRSYDWILQIDTDEALPDFQALIEKLEWADHYGLSAVEWPMRVLYRHMHDHSYLEVCGEIGEYHYEYPGAIAVKPGARLRDARRVSGAFLRPVVVDDHTGLQISRPPDLGENRLAALSAQEAIIHNSWGRSPANLYRKLMNWGHSSSSKKWKLHYLRWYLAPLYWPAMHDFHPLSPALWPALKKSQIPSSFTTSLEGAANVR